jgi:hypothetical protein
MHGHPQQIDHCWNHYESAADSHDRCQDTDEESQQDR